MICSCARSPKSTSGHAGRPIMGVCLAWFNPSANWRTDSALGRLGKEAPMKAVVAEDGKYPLYVRVIRLRISFSWRTLPIFRFYSVLGDLETVRFTYVETCVHDPCKIFRHPNSEGSVGQILLVGSAPRHTGYTTLC